MKILRCVSQEKFACLGIIESNKLYVYEAESFVVLQLPDGMKDMYFGLEAAEKHQLFFLLKDQEEKYDYTLCIP
ncbi:hypothetical protein T10_1080 [Trichinella papuae]|uniref:Uncharacterized protein n=1 Tax=Trichinella papuae TaxID=268474 RepID=A0A0V1M6M6_9BILA|nr:hypothetical protein T10_1080 [Trichinella papuae]